MQYLQCFYLRAVVEAATFWSRTCMQDLSFSITCIEIFSNRRSVTV